MVKFYASAKFAVDTKNDFSVCNWRLSQTEWRKCYALSWSQKNHKQYQTLCKDFTEIAIQNFKRKKSFLYEQFLIERKIIFITLSDLPWMLLFLLRTYVTCVMGATLMLHWRMDEKAPYTPVFKLLMLITVFVHIKKRFHIYRRN